MNLLVTQWQAKTVNLVLERAIDNKERWLIPLPSLSSFYWQKDLSNHFATIEMKKAVQFFVA